ncbi:2,4'-dihydroxyacetophenone dioxygenase family protein [Peribacillus sp. NPDC094092]|uniref:2,4'-dihydroxyacetophenone dioxygenase family protein n=1 Tax=Peribacillus sp. NPDC094092 TaxID=3390611 RepID=UPI003D07000D
MKITNNILASNYVDPKELPWVPTGLGGMETKLCKVNPITGQYIVLTKSPGGDQDVPAHLHHGTVIVYTIQGKWKYIEDGWVSGPGDVVFEPAGSLHRPVAMSQDEDIITFVVIDGALEFKDENGNTLFTSNSQTVLEKYHEYCSENGIKPVDVTIY